MLAFLDLRRGQPQAAVDRIGAAAEKAPGNIEVLLTRAEILTFAETADAPDIVRSLLVRAADGMFHNAPYPVKLAARLSSAASRCDLGGGEAPGRHC